MTFTTKVGDKKHELAEGRLVFMHKDSRVTYILNKEQASRCYVLLFNDMKAGKMKRVET